MLEDQQFGPGGAIVEIEKQSTTNPGVRLQCEIPDAKPSSSLRVSWCAPHQRYDAHEGSTVGGLLFAPTLSFPDDAIPDVNCLFPGAFVLMPEFLGFLQQGAYGTSFLWPLSALTSGNAPPAGRIQLYVDCGVLDFGDTITIRSGLPPGSSFGTNILCLEEVARTVVQ